ncbi:type I restriction enzyme endonuclease domain-containing protein [Endozoicomonas sp. ALD040]|uniref:type I restriction enzyme endonuclease domain-containing protein n=1 Tax=unclassified Endozoicomonas TaxID=2644528 RepID=UPI003BB01ADA
MQVRFPDWSNLNNLKSVLGVQLIMLLQKNSYPPVVFNEVYQGVFEQLRHFKTYRVGWVYVIEGTG